MLRHVCTSFLYACAVLLAMAPPGLAVDVDTIRIQWRVPREQVAEVRDRLRLDGSITPDTSSARDTKGLPLIYIFAGIASLPYLADALVAAVRDATCGGVIIDHTSTELEIACDRRLSGGTVVVRSSEGVEVQRFKEVKDPSGLIDVIAKLKGTP